MSSTEEKFIAIIQTLKTIVLSIYNPILQKDVITSLENFICLWDIQTGFNNVFNIMEMDALTKTSLNDISTQIVGIATAYNTLEKLTNFTETAKSTLSLNIQDIKEHLEEKPLWAELEIFFSSARVLERNF